MEMNTITVGIYTTFYHLILKSIKILRGYVFVLSLTEVKLLVKLSIN